MLIRMGTCVYKILVGNTIPKLCMCLNGKLEEEE